MCRAAPCCAVLCRSACCAVLFRTCQVSFDKVSSSSTEVHHTRFVRTTLLNHIDAPNSAQLSYSSAARRAAPCGAVWCRAMPCFAFRCGAVPCCAVLYSNTLYQVSCEVPGTRYRYVRAYSVFLLSSMIVLALGPLGVLFFAKCTRTADQNVTSPTTTLHSTGNSSTQVALDII